MPCLVWAGLRRLLVQERLEGLLADGRAVDEALVAAFELWESGRGVTREAGLDFSLTDPRSDKPHLVGRARRG